MIDIYDEEGYIKNILSDGISSKWERDISLLIRYYKIEGKKKTEVKKILLEKLQESSAINYNHNLSYNRFNSIMDKLWKNPTPIRKIKQLEISTEVLEWFLNLEKEYKITEEEAEKIKNKRQIKKIDIYPLNFDRVKYLFTLYIWTKIQENYLKETSRFHDLSRYNKRFKEDANLKSSFNMNKEKILLYDLGLINLTYKGYIECSFIKKYDVFNIPITDENRIIIKTGEPPFGDLYNCGYWLEKKKYGTFICQKCGKELAHYGNKKNEKLRKYCKQCAKEIQYGTSEKWKNSKSKILGKRYCIECGDLFDINPKNHNTLRCPECKERYNKERNTIRVSNFREATKAATKEKNDNIKEDLQKECNEVVFLNQTTKVLEALEE